MHLRVEMLESVNHRRYGIGYGTGIDNQYDRNIEQAGCLGTASVHLHVSVEQSHDPFDHADFGRCCITVVKVLYMGRRSEPAVEIHRLAARRQLMIMRINIVGAAFERLNVHPPSFY